jgi:hypothetical protein
MDHNFVFNTISLPASDAGAAFSLLLDATKGMLAVGSGNDRYALYADNEPDLQSYEVTAGYTYGDFLDELARHNEDDLRVALLEIDDKSPMLEFISEGQFQEIASTAFYFPEEPYETSIDILGIAWYLDATLLSIGTSEKWRAPEVEFAEFTEGTPSTGNSYLRNVSCQGHGISLRAQFEPARDVPLSDIFLTCRFSDRFLEWDNSLPLDLKRRIRNKLTLAEEKKFLGGKPLFDTLTGADGLREMRFSAVQGGAVRVLFGSLPNNNHAVLVGFIKKSDGEGYSEAITSAKGLWAKMKSEG